MQYTSNIVYGLLHTFSCGFCFIIFIIVEISFFSLSEYEKYINWRTCSIFNTCFSILYIYIFYPVKLKGVESFLEKNNVLYFSLSVVL